MFAFLALPSDKKPAVKSPVPIALAKPTQSPKSSRTVPAQIQATPAAQSASADLLGLCSPTASSATSSATTNGSCSEAAEIVGDIFSSFLSGPTPTTAAATLSVAPQTVAANNSNVNASSLAKQEEDFFNQVAPTEQEKGKMTRDSIMALYAKTPSTATNVGQFNGGGAFNQFNGQNSFIPQQQQQVGGFGGVALAQGQFSNAHLLSQLGSTPAFSMNGNQSQGFANFGSAPVVQQQPPQQMPSFAQFPPMNGASAAAFPPVATNGFGQPPTGAANAGGAGINQQFANLHMWQ